MEVVGSVKHDSRDGGGRVKQEARTEEARTEDAEAAMVNIIVFTTFG